MRGLAEFDPRHQKERKTEVPCVHTGHGLGSREGVLGHLQKEGNKTGTERTPATVQAQQAL